MTRQNQKPELRWVTLAIGTTLFALGIMLCFFSGFLVSQVPVQHAYANSMTTADSVDNNLVTIKFVTSTIGQIVTYQLKITKEENPKEVIITQVTNEIPGIVLGIVCEACEPITTSKTGDFPAIADRSKVNTDKMTIALPYSITKITWPMQFTLTTDLPTVTLSFSRTLAGLSGGEILENSVVVTCMQNNGPKSCGKGSDTSVIVPFQLAPGRLGQMPLELKDIDRVYDMDWGDFNHDGNLDLALATETGVFVFQYNGQWTNIELEACKQDNNKARIFGVRWGDFIPGGELEFVAVGDKNCIYYNDPNNNDANKFKVLSFKSSKPLYHIEPIACNGAINFVGISFCASSSQNSTGPNPCGGYFYHNISVSNDGISVSENQIPSALPWAISVADFNRDNVSDIALARRDTTQNPPDQLAIYACPVIDRTTNSPIFANPIISLPLTFQSQNVIIEDFAWGDFDHDGFLDLAATVPMENEIRLYKNDAGLQLKTPITFTAKAATLDWADFNSDGKLDLAVGEFPPKVYLNTGDSTNPFTTTQILPTAGITSTYFKWFTVRAVDIENNGAIDLSIGNQTGPTILLQNQQPAIAEKVTPLSANATDSGSVTDVAWGDLNADGFLDLLYGSNSTATAQLYLNNRNGSFTKVNDISLSPRLNGSKIALADYNGDGKLDVAIGGNGASLRILDLTFSAFTYSTILLFEDQRLTNITSLAWGDMNGDGRLDLAVGQSDGSIWFYKNSKKENTSAFLASPYTQVSVGALAVTDIAWADWNRDFHVDVAVATNGDGVQLLRNQGNNTFALDRTLGETRDTRAIEWIDYDQDGDLDLAAGNYGQNNTIFVAQFENNNFIGFAENTLSSPLSRTTALAWGDVDGDGDWDLAVGNDGEGAQIFLKEESGLVVRWISQDAKLTTSLAWGDLDKDGDLDLAVGVSATKGIGIYENFYVSPAHLTSAFARTMPLPNQPSYVFVTKPFTATAIGSFTAPEIIYPSTFLGQSGKIDLVYQQFDPDVPSAPLFIPSDTLSEITHQYSLRTGRWEDVKEVDAIDKTVSREGKVITISWSVPNADDLASVINDEVRFRVQIVPNNPFGPVQRATTAAISLPLPVRNTNCYWPIDPTIQISPPIDGLLGKNFGIDEIFLHGAVVEGSGLLIFRWQIFDEQGNKVVEDKAGQHVRWYQDPSKPINFKPLEHTYTIKVEVEGPDCPVTRKMYTQFSFGSAARIYLPIIMIHSDTATLLSNVSSSIDSASVPNPIHLFTYGTAPLQQITGLVVSEQIVANTITLNWDAYPVPGEIHGYRVYREKRNESGFTVDVLATLNAQMTSFVYHTNECSSVYYITAFNADGESLPSTSSYYTMPCP